ncbi:MAG: hypothetical protein WD354_00430 [Acidimicrobiia bacterium]
MTIGYPQREQTLPGEGPAVSKEFWGWSAVAFFAGAASYAPSDHTVVHMSMVAALGGLVAAFAYLQAVSPRKVTWIPGLILVTGLTVVRVLEPLDISSSWEGWNLTGVIVIAVAICTLLAVGPGHNRRERVTATRIALVAGALLVGGLLVETVEVPTIDVLALHGAAADALTSGESPYSSAVVVPDSSRYAEPGDVIVGYTYPPLTMVAYSLGYWLGGDARWTSVLAVVVTLLALDLPGAPSRDRGRRMPALLLLALPVWPIVIYLGWTEPLTLMLMVLALGTWTRWPIGSAILMGLALASKQYGFVLAPLVLLFARREGWIRPITIAGSAAVTLIPSFILDPSGFVKANLINLTRLPIRPDGSSIQGLLVNLGLASDLPLILTAGLPILVSVLMVSRVLSLASLSMASAMILTILFLLGSQAFFNYWFLVAGLLLLFLKHVNLEASPSELTKAPYHMEPRRAES